MEMGEYMRHAKKWGRDNRVGEGGRGAVSV